MNRGEVWSVAVDAVGETIAVGSAERSPQGGAFHWRRRSGQPIIEVDANSPVWGVAVSPSGRYAAYGTWGGEIEVYQRTSNSAELVWKTPRPLGDSGIYGIKVTDAGRVVASVYDTGIFVRDVATDRSVLVPLETGLYNVSRVSAAATALVGLREGSFAEIDLEAALAGEPALTISEIHSRGPLSGVACATSGSVIYVAGFDGTLLTLTQRGEVLWRANSRNELWSVAASADGRLLAAASGGGYIQVFQQAKHSPDVSELRIWSAVVQHDPSAIRRFADRIYDAGAFEYGFQTLDQLISKGAPQDGLKYFALLAERSGNPIMVYRAAQLYERIGEHRDALRSYQRAAEAPELYATALTAAGGCFDQLGLPGVTAGILKHATQPPPTDVDTSLFYDLGRLYEDLDQSDRAIRAYQAVVQWDAAYRDALERLTMLIRRSETDPEAAVGNGGLGQLPPITGFLGPNVPRLPETDARLHSVLTARARELGISNEDHHRRRAAILNLANADAFVSGRAAATQLQYDSLDYHKYDNSPVEDAAKKHLEAINLLAEVDHRTVTRSLDIGTATCRYPSLLANFGIETHGVDVSREGFDYHRSTGGTFQRFVQGNGAHLPYRSSAFQLLTCMMGTFNHVGDADRSDFLGECRRVLDPQGVAILGLWDPECPHVSYLAMYSDHQRELLRRGAISQASFSALALKVGFAKVKCVPFAMPADGTIRALHLDMASRRDVEMLADTDFALRGRTRSDHGQMYLAVCYRDANGSTA
ncbi:methyltransferase domain-containing protein [Dactylosporangium sp. CA-092794]|uniref:methyltransferase domain-containing protein n=1 Tax=Dactylosporangium sp. CA-092794 TaxID=3239929 RepID=UPI003D8B7E61